jgi:hypothetical protein
MMIPIKMKYMHALEHFKRGVVPSRVCKKGEITHPSQKSSAKSLREFLHRGPAAQTSTAAALAWAPG